MTDGYLTSLSFIDLFVYCFILFYFWKVDKFFMKTCSFRGSYPRSMDGIIKGPTEGLFCIDPPETRHFMLPCCYQSLDISCRREPSVRFASKNSLSIC